MGRKPRWLQHVLVVYPFIIETVEVMTLKLHLEIYSEWSKFDQENGSCTNRVLGSLRNFRFLIMWIMMVKALSYIKGPIKRIQGRSLELYELDR